MVANAMMASAGAVAGDKTPDAVNWANIGPGVSPQTNANQTINGIDGSIALQIDYTGGGSNIFYYSLDGGAFTIVANGGTFSVSDGQTVRFQTTRVAAGTSSGTVTISNNSDGGTALDTFTYSVGGIAP